MRVLDFQEVDERHVLIRDRNDSILVYQHHYGALTRVNFTREGRITAHPLVVLSERVLDGLYEMIVKTRG